MRLYHEGAKAKCPVRAQADHSSSKDQRKLQGERIPGNLGKWMGCKQGHLDPEKRHSIEKLGGRQSCNNNSFKEDRERTQGRSWGLNIYPQAIWKSPKHIPVCSCLLYRRGDPQGWAGQGPVPTQYGRRA